MPVYQIGLDDGRSLRIEADSQEAALAGVAHFQSQEKQAAPVAPASTSPSGVWAGLQHGAAEAIRGNTATSKDFYGTDGSIGDKLANAVTPKDYVPANITNGSANPLNWNVSQIPQKIAEGAPGLAQHILAAGAAAKVAKTAGAGVRGAALAALLGGGASMWNASAGNDANADAVARTGNPDAKPETQDLVRGGLTAAGEAAVQSVNPLRFIPGANKIGTVGAQGTLDAIKKYLATSGTGAATAAAGDAVNQVGSTVGTDAGVQFDPKRTLEAAAGGAVTNAALAAPRGVADVTRATSLREHGGANMPATVAVASRLQDAGDNGLGRARNDYTAMETVKADLKNELSDAARSVRASAPLSADADNALQRAQTGKPLTASDVDLINRSTAGAPDGANAAFLANQMRMAQLLQERGSYDPSAQKWAGGISGAMDKSLRYFFNPARALTGVAATGLGIHLLGTASPSFAGAALGAYGTARALDGLTGARSPANMFAQHFADMNAATRLPAAPMAPAAPAATPVGPTGPQVTPYQQPQPWGPTPPPAPPPGPASPWGPRPPMTGPTGPTVAPPAPPVPPPAPLPTFNPMALAALKQSLKTGLPPTPAPPPPPVAPAPPAPPPLSPLAVKMLQAKLKAGLPPTPVVPDPEPSPAPPTLSPAQAVDPLALPTDITKRSKNLMAGMAAAKKMQDAATAVPTPTKITKSNGKVNEGASSPSNDPYAHEADSRYEPIPADQLYKNGLSHEVVAQQQAEQYRIRPAARYNYERSVIDTMGEKQDRIESVANEASPEEAHVLRELMDQLHHRNDRRKVADAIIHYGKRLSPETRALLRKQFNAHVLERLWPTK